MKATKQEIEVARFLCQMMTDSWSEGKDYYLAKAKEIIKLLGQT